MTTKSQPSRNVLMGILHIALILFFATHLHSCTDEQTDHPTPNGEEKMITFSVKVPGGFTPATYALAETDENAVNTVDVLLFNKSNSNYISGPHYGSIEKDKDDNSKANVTIRIPENASNYDMVVLANCRSDINGKDFTNDNKTTALAKLIWSVKADKSKPDWLETAGKKTIPMFGEFTSGTVNLTRMLARVNVTNNASASFTLTSVYLCNYNDAGNIAPTSTIADPNKTGISNAILYTSLDENGNCINEIYTFEAATADASNYNLNSPCLVIGGTYDSKTYYYRVDFVKKESDDTYTYLNLLRNHKYEVEISNISGPGYEQLADAYAAKPVNIAYSISSWNEAKVGGVTTDGQYKLGVSAATLDFDANPRNYNDEDKTNLITVFSDYVDNKVTISNISPSNGWLRVHIDGQSSPLSNNTDIALVGGTASLRLVLDDNSNGGETPRTGSFLLTSGRMSYTVNVKQSNKKSSIGDIATFIIPEIDQITYSLDGSTYTFKVFSTTPFSIDQPADFASLSYDGSSAALDGERVVTFTTKTIETPATSETRDISLTFRSTTDPSYTYSSTLSCATAIAVPEPMSNSYIVSPISSSPIYIPVSQLYRAMNDASVPTGLVVPADAALPSNWAEATDNFVSELVWQDKATSSLSLSTDIVGGTGPNAYLKVQVTNAPDDGGNAVIGIRKDDGSGVATGTILWSWHIWVTKYDPDGADAVPSTGAVAMDRNLGALNATQGNAGALGLLYQWGRKDPFPGANATSGSTFTTIYTPTGSFDSDQQKSSFITAAPNTPTSHPGNLELTVKNPLTFYTGSDWYDGDTGIQNDALWGGGDPNIKTVYDPCPPGWRVPVLGELTGGYYNSTNTSDSFSGNGWSWSSNGMNVTAGSRSYQSAWFPASGYRVDSHGLLATVGTYGLYWLGATNSTFGHRVFFTSSGNVYASFTINRAYASSVRCLQEK